jgi:hypothetical protein
MSAILDEGKAHLAAGRLDEAAARFEQLIQAQRELGDANYGLGLVRLASKDQDGAWTYFTRAVDADPGHVNALLRLAKLAAAAGDASMAISLYAAVLVRDSGATHALASINALVGSSSAAVAREMANGPGPAQPTSGPRSAAESSPEPTRIPPPRGTGSLHPPYPPSSNSSIVGTVGSLNQSTAPWRGKVGAMQRWTFRVQSYDQSGQPQRPIGVEIKGHEIQGILRNGDWVEISESPQPGKTLSPRSLRNLTDYSEVKAKWRVLPFLQG